MSDKLSKETEEKMLRLLEDAWQQGHDAALRSEPVADEGDLSTAIRVVVAKIGETK